MGKEEILNVIESMREEGLLKGVSLSGYINMKLRGEQIEEVYQLLDKDNMIIVLRSVIKQFVKTGKRANLKLNDFEEIVNQKSLADEMFIKLFKAVIINDEEKSYEAFTEACDLLHKNQN